MLAEIIARLTAQAPTFKTVAGAAEFAALKNGPPKERQPAAYVIPIADQAGANKLVNGVRQQVASRFGVVLALGNLGDPRGEAASKAIETTRAAVRAALIGWSPTAGDDPVTFAQGRMIGIQDGVVWWQDEFITGNTLSQV